MIFKYLKLSGKKCASCIALSFLVIGVRTTLPLTARFILNLTEQGRNGNILSFLLVYLVFLFVSSVFELLMTASYQSSYKGILAYGKERLKNVMYMDSITIFSCISVSAVSIVTNLLIIVVFSMLFMCL